MFLYFYQLALAPLLGPYPQAYTASQPPFAAYGVPLANLITGQCTSLATSELAAAGWPLRWSS